MMIDEAQKKILRSASRVGGISRRQTSVGLIALCVASLFCSSPSASAQAQDAKKDAAVVSATKAGDTILIESKGGAVTYKAVVDGEAGGDITQVNLPADGKVVARELNDIFFRGEHGEQYTLRGWIGRSKFLLSHSMEVISQKSDEVVVQVNVLATGTFRIVDTNETAAAKLRQTLVGYKDKTIQVKRTYTFKPDRVVMNDELLWVYPDVEMVRFDVTPAFMPGCVQGPVRMVKGAARASFYMMGSAGGKLPKGMTYPFTAQNFLKNGYEVSLLTTAASFDLAKSDTYFYEKAEQQDWYQLSGFMYDVAGYPSGKWITLTNEVVFSKAKVSEMPPVVTIQSPPWTNRWMDEKGEVAPFKIGDTVKLAASAVNSDGSAVPDKDISWDIHIDPWWNTPSVILKGGKISYKLPEVVDETDKKGAKNRSLLAVIQVKVKGKNGTEAVELFVMLVGKGT